MGGPGSGPKFDSHATHGTEPSPHHEGYAKPQSKADVNENGHAYGSPEALADFKAKYGGPRNVRAEQRSFNTAKREINRFKSKGK